MAMIRWIFQHFCVVRLINFKPIVCKNSKGEAYFGLLRPLAFLNVSGATFIHNSQF